MTQALYFLLCVVGVSSAPVDDPIRIDLPVYDQPQSASNTIVTEAPEPENFSGSEPDYPRAAEKAAIVVLGSKSNSNTLVRLNFRS